MPTGKQSLWEGGYSRLGARHDAVVAAGASSDCQRVLPCPARLAASKLLTGTFWKVG